MSKSNLKGKGDKESRENLVQRYLQQYLMLNQVFGWQDVQGTQHWMYVTDCQGISVRAQPCMVASEVCHWVSAGKT